MGATRAGAQDLTRREAKGKRVLPRIHTQTNECRETKPTFLDSPTNALPEFSCFRRGFSAPPKERFWQTRLSRFHVGKPTKDLLSFLFRHHFFLKTRGHFPRVMLGRHMPVAASMRQRIALRAGRCAQAGPAPRSGETLRRKR